MFHCWGSLNLIVEFLGGQSWLVISAPKEVWRMNNLLKWQKKFWLMVTEMQITDYIDIYEILGYFGCDVLENNCSELQKYIFLNFFFFST